MFAIRLVGLLIRAQFNCGLIIALTSKELKVKIVHTSRKGAGQRLILESFSEVSAHLKSLNSIGFFGVFFPLFHGLRFDSLHQIL